MVHYCKKKKKLRGGHHSLNAMLVIVNEQFLFIFVLLFPLRYLVLIFENNAVLILRFIITKSYPQSTFAKDRNNKNTFFLNRKDTFGTKCHQRQSGYNELTYVYSK